MPVDYSKYHPNWPLIRAIISHRDRNRCKFCRAPHRLYIWRSSRGPWYPWTPNTRPPPNCRRILCVCTVAHLDWNRDNNHPDNLALLCQRCHLQHDRPQHLYRRLRSKLRRTGQIQLIPAAPPTPATKPKKATP